MCRRVVEDNAGCGGRGQDEGMGWGAGVGWGDGQEWAHKALGPSSVLLGHRAKTLP